MDEAPKNLYIQVMRIVWDEPKRPANIAKHGLDFADLDVAYFAAAVIRPGHSGRFLAIGRHRERILVAVFRPLGTEAISIISFAHGEPK